MLRSAALLSPIAYMNLIPSVEIRFAADKFLADVRQVEKVILFLSIKQRTKFMCCF
jgi:hypothetical protein